MHKDNTGFWTSWNSKCKRRTNQRASAGGFTDNADTANAFADNFASDDYRRFFVATSR